MNGVRTGSAVAADRRQLAADLRAVCMRVSRRTRFAKDALVPPHQASVLGKLTENVLTPRELADIECVSAPSMTRTVGCLVDKGLVRREADPSDGRQVRLFITDEGRTTIARVRAQRDEWMLERLSALSEQECAVLEQAQEILGRVVAA
ncbi:MarR family winged helix-turn-helix transcriptional regulator [Branchiibius sp. NY16-3462-2]|uniref:MarR family winged helix-turn-helix transcriptional regulator n=1 Tax=Branchiibius sp. NY16-3462-2 TaxID=1807500 RepID=UPI000798A37A|nr:MarR family transcriptional regulator [Branchiibius sp. NY16-3462-2]KYH44641.1 hypothetical protein AZH51_00260 [Branchiibius sp. NY16-3462-2]